MNRLRLHFSAPCVVLALAACAGNDVKDTLGINHSAPDEYRVVSRPPLSVPPQFNLRPPAAPGEVQAVSDADQKAESLLLGSPQAGNTFSLQDGEQQTASVKLYPMDTGTKATPETNFLQRAGAGAVNPNIRSLIEHEKAVYAQPVEEEDSWWNVLSDKSSRKEPVVNAKGEAERIKKNEEEGKPVTEGETPEVEGKDTGVLGRIFGY